MKQFWLVVEEQVIRGFGAAENGEPPKVRYVAYRPYETFEEAKQVAATKAGTSNKPFFVCYVVGFQQPMYDPEIGWNPTDAT